ncbi:MAG: trans-aconitate 2-methyltransferase [Planctomycetota bacterium]
MSDELPRMYAELAPWWPLISTPDDYAEEAETYRRALEQTATRELREVLELGSGGGNNASHLAAHFQLTLLDRAPGMLAVSRALNPECEHVEGDMRSARLGREFDAVFVHDAVSYLTSLADLRAAMDTAFAHLRPGGAALFGPDHVREAYRPGAYHGGHDDPHDPERGARYLQWQLPAADAGYAIEFVYLLREGGAVRHLRDTHHCGLFGRAEWFDALAAAGFVDAAALPLDHSEMPDGGGEFFVARRP